MPVYMHEEQTIPSDKKTARPSVMEEARRRHYGPAYYLRLTIERVAYLTWQPGKKVLDTIFDACPLVALDAGRKYGKRLGPHGSPVPPHG